MYQPRAWYSSTSASDGSRSRSSSVSVRRSVLCMISPVISRQSTDAVGALTACAAPLDELDEERLALVGGTRENLEQLAPLVAVGKHVYLAQHIGRYRERAEEGFEPAIVAGRRGEEPDPAG